MRAPARRGALAAAAALAAVALALAALPAPAAALKIRNWATLGHHRVKVPLTVQFPTIHSMVELERYYRDRAKEVPDLMTYSHVEEADNPALRPKARTSLLCTLIRWCHYEPSTCDAECRRESYLPVIRLTNRKSAKPDKEKKKIMIISSPNAPEAIGTDEWMKMFVEYMTFDWHEIERDVGLKLFWDNFIRYYLDPEFEEIFGGWGLNKKKPAPKTHDEEMDAKYKEDEDYVEQDELDGRTLQQLHRPHVAIPLSLA